MASELSLISIGRYDDVRRYIALASGRGCPEWTFIDPTTAALGPAATRAKMKPYLDFFDRAYGPYPATHRPRRGQRLRARHQLRARDPGPALLPRLRRRRDATHEPMHQWFGDTSRPSSGATSGSTRARRRTPRPSTPARAPPRPTFYNQWNDTPAARPGRLPRRTRPTRLHRPVRLARLPARRDGARGAAHGCRPPRSWRS